MNFNFIASDNFDVNTLSDVVKFVDNYPNFQSVVLSDENELKLLLELIGIHEFVVHELKNSEFSKYWDISTFKLPEYDEKQFDEFYSNWINKSQRDNNMDEYGNLIFLQGISSEWNKLNYKLIVKEN